MILKLFQVVGAYWPYLLIDALIAYLLGSLSFAILVSRAAAKVDIREHGSGNAGMTNVLRTLGNIPAMYTTIGDVGKSVAAVLIGGWLLTSCAAGVGSVEGADTSLIPLADPTRELVGRYIAGLFCVLGHLFPVFFGFRGGKGVLVTFGMLLVMDWRVALLALLVFLVAVALSRMVSLGSLTAAVAAVPLTWVFDRIVRGRDSGTALFCTIVTALMALIVFYMHRGNIARILNHTERKLTFGKHGKEE